MIESKISGDKSQKEGPKKREEASLCPQVITFLCSQLKKDAYAILGLSQEGADTLVIPVYFDIPVLSWVILV